MLLSSAIENFLMAKRADGFSPSTINVYSYALKIISGYLDNPELKTVTPDQMTAFWVWVRTDYKPNRTSKKAGPLAGRSLENIWTAERSCFGWCIETGKLKKRPDLHVKKPMYAERTIMPLTEDEINRLLETASYTRIAQTTNRAPFRMPRPTAKRDIAIIELLTETGIRVSELARLLREDIDFDNGEITIQPYGTGRKTKMRVLPIGRKTRLSLWEYLDQRSEKEEHEIDKDDYVFYSMTGRPMNKDSIRLVLNEIGEQAGVKNVHPHRFRHSFASEMAANEVTEYHLMEMLGHSTTKMAQRYVNIHQRKLKRISIVDKLKKK